MLIKSKVESWRKHYPCGCRMVGDGTGKEPFEIERCAKHDAAPDMLEALEGLMCWTMRDGTPCSCPAGKDEWEPKGKMPTLHATSCEEARGAIAKAKEKE